MAKTHKCAFLTGACICPSNELCPKKRMKRVVSLMCWKIPYEVPEKEETP